MFLTQGCQRQATLTALATRRWKRAQSTENVLVAVKRGKLGEVLVLSASEVDILCSKLDKMPGRSCDDEVFKGKEHRRARPFVPPRSISAFPTRETTGSQGMTWKRGERCC